MARLPLLSLLFALPLLAQGSPEAKILEKLHGKLADAFLGAARKTRPQALLLVNPAIPAPPFAADVAPSLDDLYLLSSLVNPVPAPGWVYSGGTTSVSSVYKTMLEFGQVAQTLLPDPQAEMDLRTARNTLYTRRSGPRQPSDKYKAYLRLQDEYGSALEKLENAKAEARNGGPAVPAGLEQAASQASTKLDKEGYRQEIEAALALIQKRYDQDLYVGFSLNRQKLNDLNQQGESLNGKPWFRTLTEPPPEKWASSAGWVAWSFQDRDLDAQPTRAATAGTPAKGALPLSSGSHVDVRGLLKRVDVVRPWMDPQLFYSRSWRLLKSSPFKLVSSGKPEASEPGVMPYLVTGLLLARDLEITGTWPKADVDRLLASGSAQSLGPFALSAAKAGTVKTTVQEKGGTLTIKIQGYQIIAYLCDVLPRVPDPDPGLSFPE